MQIREAFHVFLDSLGEGEGGMFQENRIETCIIYGETDHQPRSDAWDKCSGLVHWEDPEGSGREGGGRGDRNGEYSKFMADSCQCMTKTTTIL